MWWSESLCINYVLFCLPLLSSENAKASLEGFPRFCLKLKIEFVKLLS